MSDLGQMASVGVAVLVFFPLAKAEAITYLFDPWIEGFRAKSMTAASKHPCGAVAQLGECLTGSQEVASSILASSTI